MPSSFAIPSFLEERLSVYDGETAAAIVDAMAGPRRTALRVNPLRSTIDEVKDLLDGLAISYKGLDWLDHGFVIEEPEDADSRLRATELYENGGFYIQNPSAMLATLALDPRSGEDILDMCAAPGGKTTHICALTGNGAYITACEMNGPRAEKLAFNLERQGTANVTLMRTDSRELDDLFSFDRILLDAPCTGSGTLRLDDPKMPERFTAKLLQKTTKAQRALLDKALRLLKPGGTLLYATCSILPEENGDALTKAMNAKENVGRFEIEPLELPADCDATLLPGGPSGTLTLIPDDVFEGFFIAKVVRKR